MKQIFLLIIFMFLGFLAVAQTYIGTLTVGDYIQKNTTVKLQTNSNGVATLTMYRAKFAYLMPVRLDIEMSPVKVYDGKLRGDGIIPIAKGKRYEKYRVRDLKGKRTAEQLSFSCIMGTKSIKFSGNR